MALKLHRNIDLMICRMIVIKYRIESSILQHLTLIEIPLIAGTYIVLD